MAQTAWTAWYDYVLPDVPGCLQPMAAHHIKLAAIEFCERSRVLRFKMDPITVSPNLEEYDLAAETAGYLVVSLESLWYRHVHLKPKTPAELSAIYGDWMNVKGSGPECYTMIRPRVLRLVPIPLAASPQGLTGLVSVKPKKSATGADSLLFDEWADQIAQGAMARLFAMKKKPWSDGVQAAFRLAKFDEAIAKASGDATRGFVRSHGRVKAHFL